MELDEIKAIVELMAKHNLSEFKVEAENMHLCLKRESADKGTIQQIAVPAGVTMAAPVQTPLPAATAEAAPNREVGRHARQAAPATPH